MQRFFIWDIEIKENDIFSKGKEVDKEVEKEKEKVIIQKLKTWNKRVQHFLQEAIVKSKSL
jgi:hypothetical protein